MVGMGNVQAEAAQNGLGVLADDASVTSNTNLLGCLRDGAIHNDNLGIIARDCSRESSIRRDCGGSATSTPLGASILAGITSSDLIQCKLSLLV